MKSHPHNEHSNCNENPKGFLRRLAIPNGRGIGRIKSTPYFVCDCCNIVVHVL